MADKSHMRMLASLDEASQGLFFAGMAMLGGLIDQRAVNRARLIDYLLLVRADLSPEERTAPYGLWLQVLIDHLEILERAQMQKGDDKPH